MIESKRIKALCGELEKCESFADVGCDHGYCTQYMLDNDLCDKAIVSDVSAPSLQKAETLLKKYIEQGKLSSVCCNGLEKIDKNVSLVLIAGMGGREIIDILKRGFLPQKFVFQPMKNSEELRRYLVEKGCKIVKDFTFRDDKFYDVIKGEREGGTEAYSDEEYEFGRDNLLKKNNDFKAFLLCAIEKLKSYPLDKMSEESKRATIEKIQRYEKVLYAVSQ